MELNNRAKDLIGHLRAVNLLTVLLNVDDVRFPLDGAIASSLAEHGDRYDELLRLSVELCGAGGLVDEVQSAITEIVDASRPGFWDEEWTCGLLSLYAGQRRPLDLHFNVRATFRKELAPILKDQVCRLIETILWLRVAYYDSFPADRLSPPKPLFKRALTIVHGLTPREVELPPPREHLADCLSRWSRSEVILRNISSTTFADSGLQKVLNELDSPA